MMDAHLPFHATHAEHRALEPAAITDRCLALAPLLSLPASALRADDQSELDEHLATCRRCRSVSLTVDAGDVANNDATVLVSPPARRSGALVAAGALLVAAAAVTLAWMGGPEKTVPIAAQLEAPSVAPTADDTRPAGVVARDRLPAKTPANTTTNAPANTPSKTNKAPDKTTSNRAAQKALRDRLNQRLKPPTTPPTRSAIDDLEDPFASSGMPTAMPIPQRRRSADVRKVLRAAQYRFRRCGESETLRLRIKMKISPRGRPSSVSVKSTPDSPTAERCIARVVRGLRFSQAKKSSSVSYPIVLRRTAPKSNDGVIDPFASGRPSAGLPEKPSTKDVRDAMRANRLAARRCAERHPGALSKTRRVRVKLTIQPSGRVASATTRPRNAISRCIERATMGLRFPASQKGIRFTYGYNMSSLLKSDAAPTTNPFRGCDGSERGEDAVRCAVMACTDRDRAGAKRYLKRVTSAKRRQDVINMCGAVNVALP